MKYKKIPNNENAIEIDGKVVLSFDPKYKEYLKWRDENPDLEQELSNKLNQELRNRRLHNNGAPIKDDGLWKWFNSDGQLLMSSERLKDGVADGLVFVYRESGNVKVKENYKADKKHGEFIFYNDNEQVMMIENYKDGQKHGEFIFYNNRGEVYRREIYFNNLLHGEYIDYHLNSKERSKGELLYGMMEGKWTFWYHNGKKELECEFDFGSIVGSAKIYHDTGVLKDVVTL
ncbi:hypothetical protein H8D04_00950 [bacterium]|nr:hypothetical protein [bacterium]